MVDKKKLKKRVFGKTGSVISMLTLTTSFFLVEIVVGYLTNSMALVADSFHMLSDVMSLIVGFVALRYSKRSERTDRNTFGWQRAEVLGALVNAVFLIALCFSILVESFKRIVEPEHISQAVLVLSVGAAGLFINVIGLAMFHRHGHGHSHGGGGHGHSHSDGGEEQSGKRKKSSSSEVDRGSVRIIDEDDEWEPANEEDSLPTSPANEATEAIITELPANASSAGQLNMRGVYLHVLGDALGSVIVIISALIIKFAKGEWTIYVDPVMSILMVCLILKTSIPLLKESSLILLQTVPTHIKIKEVQDRLLDSIDGVLSVHEFHVWQLAGDKIIASAHITCQSPEEYMAIANKIKQFFHDEGIHSTTIQPEFVEDHSAEKKCVLECGENEKSCDAQKCCTNDNKIRQRPVGNGDEEVFSDNVNMV